jgi:TetR/AcrR family transcriptional regulator, mexCD-oprJ operon repressor
MMAEATSDHRRAVAERNVEAILDAAERLLERGAGASVTAVAAEAGLSRVTVYAHFATRPEVVAAVVERAVRRTATAVEEADPTSGPALEALDRVIAVGWAALDRHSAMANAAAEYLGSTEMAHAHRTVHEQIRNLVVRGRREGAFRTDVPVEWLVASFFALMHTCGDLVRACSVESSDAVQILQTTVRDVVSSRVGEG